MPNEGYELQEQMPHPQPYRHNKHNDNPHKHPLMKYEPDSDTEESLITKHFHTDTIEVCPQPIEPPDI